MAKPKVIILDSPNPKTIRNAIAISSAYISSELTKRPCITDFFSCVDENVNRMFCLPLSTDYYKDKLDEATEEFFGYTPRSVYDYIRSTLADRFGNAFFGRNLARRLHRDNISDVYLVAGSCYPESILAVAHEVGIKNICIINLQGEGDAVTYDQSGYQNNVILNSIRVLNLPLVGDYAMHRLIIQGAVKGFLES